MKKKYINLLKIKKSSNDFKRTYGYLHMYLQTILQNYGIVGYFPVFGEGRETTPLRIYLMEIIFKALERQESNTIGRQLEWLVRSPF